MFRPLTRDARPRLARVLDVVLYPCVNTWIFAALLVAATVFIIGISPAPPLIDTAVSVLTGEK
jgi:hypothetical protein